MHRQLYRCCRDRLRYTEQHLWKFRLYLCQQFYPQKAYADVYQSIRACYDILLTERYHFSLLKSNKSNFAVCADKAHEICEKLFELQTTERNGCLTRSIFQKRFDDIDQALEDFRCRIYRKQKPDYPERIPVLATPQLKDYEGTKK